MSPYRKRGQVVEPDPFPAASSTAMKEAEEAKVRHVALLARKLVATARVADLAREAFPAGTMLRKRTDEAVVRSFEALASSVDDWKKVAP